MQTTIPCFVGVHRQQLIWHF